MVVVLVPVRTAASLLLLLVLLSLGALLDILVSLSLLLADDAAAGLGAGAFLEKNEKRFFCLGGGLVDLAIVYWLVITKHSQVNRYFFCEKVESGFI